MKRLACASKIEQPYSQMWRSTMLGFCLPNHSYLTTLTKSIRSKWQRHVCFMNTVTISNVELMPDLSFFSFDSLGADTSKLAKYIDPVAKGMVSNKEYAELNSFFRTRPEIFSKISRNVEQSLETIYNNNRWQEQNYAKIGRILTNADF